MFKKKKIPLADLQDKIGLVYADTPTFIDGALIKVVDRDAFNGDLYVATLDNVYKHKGEVMELLNGAKTVKPEFIHFFDFKKPKKSYLKPLLYIATLGMGLLLGTHLEAILGL